MKTPKSKMPCGFEPCGRLQSYKGYCGGHYQQLRRGVELSVLKQDRRRGCEYPGCPRHHCARGYCNSHYNQLMEGRALSPLAPIKSGRRGCAVDSCDRPHYGRGFCQRHWHEYRNGIEPGTRPCLAGTPCSFPGCGRAVRTNGLCSTHADNLRTKGELKPIESRSIHDECRYDAAHHRVTNLWGKASQYPCIECGNQAKDWAYDRKDETELYGETVTKSWCFYSRYPEFYMPMCGSCHRRRDMRAAAAELHEYRLSKLEDRNRELSYTLEGSQEKSAHVA